MSDIKKKLSVDYLRGSSANSSSAQRPPVEQQAQRFMDDALISYGRKVLEVLEKGKGEKASVYEICEQIQVPIDTVLKVVEYLQSKAMIEIVNSDLKGNHELHLVPAGKKLLA